ncbi:ABC transporter ATP-binding protein [Agromyces intestinalis]|uniref:ABC transporter ATP-binding protein n=2 Tax=Agromyces intestinalis TaxID=2592652 RepID=A0A5C1YMK2_9MICO|nr:ABC transporter ATP-binding protein [Agromyces intestinalis]
MIVGTIIAATVIGRRLAAGSRRRAESAGTDAIAPSSARSAVDARAGELVDEVASVDHERQVTDAVGGRATAPAEPEASDPLVAVDDLRVAFGDREVVAGVSLSIAPGECVAIVGESGSGKSVTARALLGLAGEHARVTADRLELEGGDLRGLGARRWRAIRGERVGLVLQDALVSLDPLRPIGREIADAPRLHRRLSVPARTALVRDTLERVGMPAPDRRASQRSGELSGGLRQRALIASAIVLDPPLVIADEPTTALDASVQRRVLDELARLKAAGTGLLLITHDLAVVAGIADRVLVMRDGRIVEQGSAHDVLTSPRTAYARELVAAADLPARDTTTAGAPPAQSTTAPVLAASGLAKSFGDRIALDGVGFELRAGETLGVVGESGSGKTTLARAVLGLMAPDAGTIGWFGLTWADLDGTGRRSLRRRVGLVAQDTASSFDPRWSVGRTIADALPPHVPAAQREARVGALLADVGLPATIADRAPATLSGGQRQRVAIARALAAEPDVLVLDEPVSALDVTVQARVLALLDRLQRERGLAYLFISHDLGVVRHLADRVLVLHDGRVVESGPAAAVFDSPTDAYTRQLLADRLTLDPARG